MVQLFTAPPSVKADPAIPQDRPVYRILNEQGYFGPDDSLYPMGSIIVLFDTPNEDMEPLNDLAREIFGKYIDELEESARKVAEKNGRYFAGRPRTRDEMIAQATEDARRVQTTMNPNGVKIMGAKKDTRKRIQQVGSSAMPDVGADNEAAKARVEKLA